ncbi:MAG: hypothetical protein CMP68_00575 [Flavobacteriales bacterium]|nr:hypothetical protein [Flavobacteriales bacterium]
MLKIFKNIFFGILIGIANIIPGLSGATVALILGVYEQLINSISSIKKKIFMMSINLESKIYTMIYHLTF